MKRNLGALVLIVAVFVPCATLANPQLFRVPARFESTVAVAGALTVTGTTTFTTIAGANGETIANSTDDMWILQGAAGSDNTDLTVDLDGTAPRLFSTTDTTIQIDEILDVTGNSTLLSADFGGGYGSTGITASSAGVLQCDGSITTAADLYVLGDDIFATTNTSGAIWVGDGTNYNPVVVSGDGAIGTNGVFTVQANAVGAAEIANTARSVNLPLLSWINCSTAELLNSTSGADASPDYAIINGHVAITYDVTGGSVDDDSLCATVMVPPDYASGGSVELRVKQGGATVTNLEALECEVSVDGAAEGSAGSDTLANTTDTQTASVTPGGTWAAGASLSIGCWQGNATPDDAVSILSAKFLYTAAQ